MERRRLLCPRGSGLVRILSLILVSLLFSSEACADGPLLDVFGPVSCSAVLYDNRNGLPTSEANAIAETDEGFIWIGSYSGLVRYDGSRFVHYSSAQGLTGVMSLYVDSHKRLWVGMNDGGASVWEGDGIRLFGKEDGLKSLSVRSITEDSGGDVYLATTHGVAVVGPDLVLQQVDEPAINDAYIRSLEACGDRVYGLTKDGAVFILKDRRLLAFCSPEDSGISGIRAILADSDRPGFLYLGTDGDLLHYGSLDRGWKEESVYTAPVSHMNSLRKLGGRVWLCADNGICCLEAGRFRQLPNLPMTTSVESMMADYQGNLWFASSQQGIMKLVPNQFTDIFDQCGLDPEVVYTTCMYGGKLFVGTKNSGLLVLRDGKRVGSLPLGDGNDLIKMLEDSSVRSLIKDSRGRLWLSSFGDHALLRYDGRDAVSFSAADGLPSNRVRAVFEMDDGGILVSCSGGIAIIKDDKVVRTYGKAEGIYNSEILSAVQAGNGDILAGSDGGGIYVIGEGGTSHIGTEDGLGSEVVMRLKRSHQHELIWIVTGNSLAYMTEDRRIHTVRGFPYANNFDLYENGLGQVWVLSSNGIYVVDTDMILKGGKLSPLHYGLDEGLPCIATSNSYSGLTEAGDLYIAGMTGVARVNINSSIESSSACKMSVPYVVADGATIYPGPDGRFMLSPSVRKLTIHGHVCNYSLADPMLSYRLGGFDTEAAVLKRKDFLPVSYTNLRGGSYHFVMQLLNPQGVGTQMLDVTIVKRKALWEQPWARAGAVLLLLAALYCVVRSCTYYRTQRIMRKEREQRQLTREIVEAFAKVIDMKDSYTNGHSSRVAEYTQMLARELGYDEDTVEKYYNIALLHDIGKIGIPSEILNKPGKLTDSEFSVIKSHSALGYEALKDISIMPELAVGAGTHHERPDGRGYPRGLAGKDIPRVAQIITVADTFDAMYSDRPYRKRMNFDKAVSIMREVSGSQLMPDVVDAFLRLVERGAFRAADDHGGGTMEDINNIRSKY